MNLPTLTAFLASVLLLPSIAQASDALLDETLKAFTRCDTSFFASLETHSDAWKAYAPLQHGKNAAWIAVKNRSHTSGNSVPLRNVPPVAGMKLLSYFDESTDLGSMGHYFYWGFMVEAHPDEVAQRLTPLIEHPDLLQKVDSGYVRSELKYGDRWLNIKPQPGSAPGTTRLERVLLLEPEGPQGAQTRVSCSLQGAVDGPLLAQLRPDIPPTEYPQQVPDTAIGDVAVSEGLQKKLDLPLLQPKFKSLSYTYVSKKDSVNKASPVTVVLKAEGGLLRKTEIYSETFQVERLTKADLIQMKSKMNGIGDGRVLQTSELELKAPQSWISGQTLSTRQIMKNIPAKPNDEPTETQMACQVGQRIPARQVFAPLSGDAIKLECDQGSYRTSRAFIEDLGIALTLESTSGSALNTYEITALEVVR